MKPVNIYALTRISEPERIERLERQLSHRAHFLKVKEWEIGGLRAFVEKLSEVTDRAHEFEFFYSFTMPKLGKEFDLLRVSDDAVVNIELKSGDVSDETILKQLLQNRYYLSTLNKNTYFFTYISGCDRLVRLSLSGKLAETKWEDLAAVLLNQTECFTGDIETLFKEDRYLISPLSDPGRFLRRDYFLTSQQKDIKKQILANIEAGWEETPLIQGFTGLPGTGKTILLYDLAMELSEYACVCVYHFGSHEKELEQLDERLKRVDFYYCRHGENLPAKREYSAILIDEGHRVDETALDDILSYSEEWNAPVIISYDSEDSIAIDERMGYGSELIEKLEGFKRYRLTNKIRMNSELSAFINCVMSFKDHAHRRDYPSVSISYANDASEAELLIGNYVCDGYIYICDNLLNMPECGGIEAMEATCKEFDRVVMLMDESFFYDGSGNLRYNGTVEEGKEPDFRVRKLFHGLSRAKSRIALVVKGNDTVFNVLLFILQH